ncbi:MAG: DUF2510 domain-containing protein [Ilumatobacteraceae bacterium]
MAVAGWYSDPFGQLTFRYWGGSIWTGYVSDGFDVFGDTAKRLDLGSMTAPTSAPAPYSVNPQGAKLVRRKTPALRTPWLWSLLIPAGLAALGAWALSRVDAPPAAIAPAPAAATSAPARTGEEACAANFAAVQERAFAAVQSSLAGYDARWSIQGSNAWRHYGEALMAAPSAGCPANVTSAWTAFAGSAVEFGRYVEGHTGLRHAFDDSSADEWNRLAGAMSGAGQDLAAAIAPYGQIRTATVAG